MRELAIGRRAALRALALSVVAGCAGTAKARPRAWPPHPGHKPQPPRRHLPTVVIDAGHGGIDPGAIGPGNVYEKTITLATAWRLAWILAATRRFHVVMTRSGDEFVALRQRIAIARAAKADLFLSIHADALPDTAMRGLSVYTLSTKASDLEAAALARSENREVAGVDLRREPSLVRNVLFDLARQETMNASVVFAHDIVGVFRGEVALLENPIRSADFVVLTAPDIPAALVELGCLSNPPEERLLREPSYQERLALGLARAVEAYFAER